MRVSLRTATIVAAAMFSTTSIGLQAIPSAGADTASTGCMQQWMFNGVWRVKVTSVDPYMENGAQAGWQVTEVWRNGTTQTVAPGDTDSKPQILTLANGTTISTDDTRAGSSSDSAVSSHDFAEAAQLTHVEVFRAASGTVDPSVKPKSVDVTFNGALVSQSRTMPHFSTSRFDFHFNLDCTATGAAANAAGGSREIAAQPGCMNQWVSNSIWRVRVTAIGPDNSTGSDLGWAVTETWTNLTKVSLAPSDVDVQDQQLVFPNGDTLSGTNSAGSSLAQQHLTFNTFAPGGSMTAPILFRPSGDISLTETPVKLLIPFDAVTANQSRFRPHYTVIPASFRIDLTCHK
jgi:hypothetical protein